MKTNKSKKQELQEEDGLSNDEIQNIFSEIDNEQKQSEIDFPTEDSSDEWEELETQAIHDPDANYNIYYGLRSLMMENLPKGPDNKQGRMLVYEEINTFLTGKRKDKKTGRRGADARMAHWKKIKEAMIIAEKWVMDGANFYNSYSIFLDENIKRGY